MAICILLGIMGGPCISGRLNLVISHKWCVVSLGDTAILPPGFSSSAVEFIIWHRRMASVWTLSFLLKVDVQTRLTPSGTPLDWRYVYSTFSFVF